MKPAGLEQGGPLRADAELGLRTWLGTGPGEAGNASARRLGQVRPSGERVSEAGLRAGLAAAAVRPQGRSEDAERPRENRSIRSPPLASQIGKPRLRVDGLPGAPAWRP